MKKKICLLIFCSLSGVLYGQTPFVQWNDTRWPLNTQQTYTSLGSVATGAGAFVLFQLQENSACCNNVSIWLAQYSPSGKGTEQRVYQSSCVRAPCPAIPDIRLVASGDSGVLVMRTDSVLKFGRNNQLQWKTFLSGLQGCATRAGGFYVQLTDSSLVRLRPDGSSEWALAKFTGFQVQAMQATQDDGLVLTGANGTRKLNNTSASVWRVGTIGSKIRVVSDGIYVQNNTGVAKLIDTNGQINWGFAQVGLIDIQAGTDNGIFLLGSTNLIRLDRNSTQQWIHSGTFSAKANLQINSSNEALINTNSVIFRKINSTGVVVWNKTMSGVSPASWWMSDGGALIIGTDTRAAFSSKLAPDGARCEFPVITESLFGRPTAFCREGTASLSLRFSGQSILNVAGVPGLRYQWQRNGAAIDGAIGSILSNANQSGSYAVVVSQDQACSVTATPQAVQIFNQNPPVISANLRTICAGGSVVLSATGCEGTVRWSNNQTGASITVSPSATTTYTATCQVSFDPGTGTQSCVSNASNAENIQVISNSTLALGALTGGDVLCGTTSINLTGQASGGVTPYVFGWKKDTATLANNTNRQSVTEAGQYTLQVTDAQGCTVVASQRIERSNIEVRWTGKNEFCTGENTSLTASSTGGIGAVVFEWKKGNDVLGNAATLAISSSGVFEIQATDSKGCRAVASSTVTENPVPRTSAGENTTLTGTRTHIARSATTGGTAPYVFGWSITPDVPSSGLTTASPTFGPFTQNAQLSLRVTDAKGCSATASATITYVPCTTSLVISGLESFCKNGSTPLTANVQNATAPLRFQWRLGNTVLGTSNTLSANRVGEYVVTVTDTNGCTATSNAFRLAEKGGDLIALISPAGPTTVFSPNVVRLNANTGLGLAYQWRRDNADVQGATNASIEASISGSYVVVISRDGCSVPSQPVVVTIEVPLSANPSKDLEQIIAGPNPSTDLYRLQLRFGQATTLSASLSDTRGVVCWQKNVTEKRREHTLEVATEHLSPGVYLLWVETPQVKKVWKIQKAP
jgi:hypothetical protein